ncbi:MAG TPA: aspartate aminotransferase family protein [Bacillota bacterium]|nr:aspartate aminotransferase family protein [Bacillota bacterium]
MTIQELESRYIINTYNRQPEKNLCLVEGRGSLVKDETGREYLDFVGGLAVQVVGHCHPAVVEAIRDQAGRLMHVSNLYYSGPQAELARVLVENSFADRVFFANSGAEANEAAIKLARKWGGDRYKIITAERSFHGRTLATVAATGQIKYHRGFAPLPEGFAYAEFNNLQSFEKLVDSSTVAIMVEPVQGEGGVHVATKSFLRGLRELCDRRELLLIYDEVQCGMGRSGHLWAYEHYGASPDIMTAAKGLGGGLPIGVMMARERAAAAFKPGDHASTFGGNLVVCRAALAVLQILLEKGFLEQVREKSDLIFQGLQQLADRYPHLVKEVRGLGLMIALELKKPLAALAQAECQARGLLVNAIGDTILRLLPPLIVSKEEISRALNVVDEVLANLEQ